MATYELRGPGPISAKDPVPTRPTAWVRHRQRKVEALKAFDFGQLIALILPALVATRGIVLLTPSLHAAFDKITVGREGALGPLVWLLIVGAAIGLTIHVTRQRSIDLLFVTIYGCFPKDEKKKAKQKRRPWR